jgi:hypothetical protein
LRTTKKKIRFTAKRQAIKEVEIANEKNDLIYFSNQKIIIFNNRRFVPALFF